MAWVVQIRQEAFDDASLSGDTILGPFRSRETAEMFALRVAEALPEVPPDADGTIHVLVRQVFPPRIRPAVRSARTFIDLLTEEEGETEW